MAFKLTPNMNIPLPNPAGTNNPEPGPQYGIDQNQGFTIIDGHDHTPGSGVQITPAGLNINTNLPFQNNQATNIYGILFSSPASNSQNTFLYTAPQSGGGVFDLFYNDGAGNVIALTQAGAVNATIASIPGESYAGGTFTWKQGAGSTTPANFDIGSITIRPNVAATTNGVVVGPPSAISSQYNIQLPLVPGVVTGIMQMNTSGDMITTLVPDNATVVISSQVLKVGVIQTANIADKAITPAKIADNYSLVPSGIILMCGQAAAPSGFLLCDGTSYLRTDYPSLFTTIGTSFGSADSTHFNVPDLRGRFARMVDGTAARDPNSGTRTAMNTGGATGNNIGSVQGFATQSHTHTITSQSSNTGGGTTNTNSSTSNNDTVTTSANSGATSTETRPINAYVNYIIKT